MESTFEINVVPAPMVKVAPAPIIVLASRIYAIFPEVASESTLTEVAAPICNVSAALKIYCNGVVSGKVASSAFNAVPRPDADTPSKFDPSPQNAVALTIPVNPNDNQAEEDDTAGTWDWAVNGAKMTSAGTHPNNNNSTIMYWAWAENPFANLYGGQSNAK